MNCWKTINFSRDVGFHRIILISLLTMLSTFILFYLPLNLYYSSTKLHGDRFIYFIIALLMTIVFHKCLHAIPLILMRKKVKIELKWITIIPIFTVRFCNMISKTMSILVFLTPFVMFTSICLLLAVMFPSYIHYFSIIAAANLGLCVPDFICLKQFISAPKRSVIEEIEDGYDILVKSN
ncbi:DUF3267 domain-containing protein [Cytobacillus sp. IB215665]|uniref:DUF3267 domain-containing protein n=1 Tax=Cytobacillus sp. IB215665 TaxID=3097357 RepID=UPI002A0F6A55|nr:DUF3267 domain-containing protein [Cytobacillus sp. IB215665]MDX8364619.1 DUF3267 domain-containing protein [Cytobacillus sp. IB215665]